MAASLIGWGGTCDYSPAVPRRRHVGGGAAGPARHSAGTRGAQPAAPPRRPPLTASARPAARCDRRPRPTAAPCRKRRPSTLQPRASSDNAGVRLRLGRDHLPRRASGRSRSWARRQRAVAVGTSDALAPRRGVGAPLRHSAATASGRGAVARARRAMRASISGRKCRMSPWIGQAAASPRAQMV